MGSRQIQSGPVSGWALCIIALTIAGCGITAPRSNEGYANLDSPGMRDTHRVMALSLGPTTLHFAALFIDDEPELKTLLRDLEGVRVRIYEVDGDSQRIAGNFERMGNKLQDDGWEQVMLVHEDDELVQMFARTSAGDIQGLTIVSADDEDVVVVNVMGKIDPAQYGDLMLALDVDEAPVVHLASAD